MPELSALDLMLNVIYIAVKKWGKRFSSLHMIPQFVIAIILLFSRTGHFSQVDMIILVYLRPVLTAPEFKR